MYKRQVKVSQFIVLHTGGDAHAVGEIHLVAAGAHDIGVVPVSYTHLADFYCPLARLVIELDGSQHYTEQGMQYDMERSAVFEQYGVQVLRFRNQDVSAHFEMVCEQIHEAVVKRLEELERGKEG